jgi:hypothetical protein
MVSYAALHPLSRLLLAISCTPTLPSPCLPACVPACLPASVGLCARLLRTCVPGASSPATGGSASSLLCPCLGQGAGVPRARRCGFYCPQCWRQPMPAAWTSRWPPTSPMYMLAMCHRCRPCLVVHPASPRRLCAEQACVVRSALECRPMRGLFAVVCAPPGVMLLCALLLVPCCCVRSSWCRHAAVRGLRVPCCCVRSSWCRHAVVCGPPGTMLCRCLRRPRRSEPDCSCPGPTCLSSSATRPAPWPAVLWMVTWCSS